ncbi:MAG: thioredoxin [Clostridiales bacterium]|jgi:thioredoxin 1|nr:thioredoxin [Clostridiales bacterium]
MADMAGKGTVKLDQGNFDEFIGSEGKLALVDFWAQWCGPCRAVAPVLEQLAEDCGDKLAVGKLNVDENRAIAERCGIQGIPTVIVYRGGRALDTLVGAMGLEDYKSAIGKHLDTDPGA